jgi:hypothetical protein
MHISKELVWLLGAVSIVISILFSFLNLNEFFVVGILGQIDNYPFGGEGPTPYYYRTAELYSQVCLTYGIVFLASITASIWALIKGKRRTNLCLFIFTLVMVVLQFIHGNIS